MNKQKDQQGNQANTLTRYWLGEMSVAERKSLEEQFFLEDDLFLRLMDAQDQLVNQYLANRLPARERARFEQYFLTSPERRENAALSAFLRQEQIQKPIAVAPSPERKESWWAEFWHAWRGNKALIAAAAVVVLALAIAPVWIALRSQSETKLPTSSVGSDVTSGGNVFLLELSRDNLRDETNQRPQANLAAETRAVRLRMDAGLDSYASYNAQLFRKGRESAAVFSGTNLQAEKTAAGGAIVIWEIPSSRLQPGSYAVNLDALNENGSAERLGSYLFDVTSR